MSHSNLNLKSCLVAISVASFMGAVNAQDVVFDYNPGTGLDGGNYYSECCDHYYAEAASFDVDTVVNGIDVYTSFASVAGGDYMISIWEDDGFGTPGSLLMQWEQAGSGVTEEVFNDITMYRHEADFDGVVVPANTVYWFGMTSVAGWHIGQSAVAAGPGDGLMAWFQGSDFFAFTNVGDMAFRLRGVGGAGDCLDLTVSTLIAGERATWEVSSATAGEAVAIVYGLQPGETGVNGFAGYCATFGIKGVNQNRLVCQKTADGGGNISCSKTIPENFAGTRILSQAAERGTCPDECVSNVDDQVIQ